MEKVYSKNGERWGEFNVIEKRRRELPGLMLRKSGEQ
jgi:hypothetical protein